MDFFKVMSTLMAQPFLALVPAGLFLGGYALSTSRWSFAGGMLWLLYCLYELGMKYRLLCSGECNIRIDLLVLYPLLVVVSLVATVAVGLALSKLGKA